MIKEKKNKMVREKRNTNDKSDTRAGESIPMIFTTMSPVMQIVNLIAVYSDFFIEACSVRASDNSIHVENCDGSDTRLQ